MTTPDPSSSCLAIIQEGPRKGSGCLFPPSENGYCGRHQRNKLYDEGIAEGRLWCRFFFRGCDNTVESTNTACATCKGKKATARTPCGHAGCRNYAKEGKYCGKHVRDSYKDLEEEQGIKFCDIARGCFNICVEGFTSCDICRAKCREKDNATYTERKTMHVKTAAACGPGMPSLQLCCYCGKDFTPFLTSHNKQSRACPMCNLSQKKQDEKRLDRVRNYKEFHATNQEAYFKRYITGAAKRSYSFELAFEEFKELVAKPCYYCGYFKEGEVNGIDRFNNDEGYVLSNCRPSCEECNHMKYTFHPLFHIEKAKLLTTHLTDKDAFFKRWACYYSRTAPATYTAYKAGAKKRSLEFALKKEQFNWITVKPCYLCGYTGLNGIDRKDSNKGYTLENCCACCHSCNVSKWNIDYSTFIERTYMIASMWADTSSITLPLPPSSPHSPASSPKKEKPSRERKHWKASSLYTGLMGLAYDTTIESFADVATREDIESLRFTILSQPADDALLTVKTFLNTCNMRRKRGKKRGADTIQHLT